jgi:hypothetical protein
MYREEAEMNRGLMRRSTLWLAALSVVAVLPLAGCGAGGEETAASAPEPATVELVEGSEELHLITLTDQAAKRLDVQTDVVTEQGKRTIVPYAAIVYETDGETWVYTNPEGLSYVRAHVVVKAIEGDRAILTKGPTAGTEVVTVGVAELFGAEHGVGADGGH